ncbi:MAG: polyprenyl synthetase family protein [Planctomycetaceae bacterium]|nr:polyprenyl synthetase family protein [Planctomycetaceae bacterium]
MTQERTTRTLHDLLGPCGRRFEGDLAKWLVEPGTPESLAAAMRYCTEGGKRLRPSLVYLSATAVGGDTAPQAELVGRCAAAVELIHCYSLVHDDLPAMDDDALRRGRPTAHVKFGEAMAILVGDALLTRAFGLLGGGPRAGQLVSELAGAAGGAALIAGQVADMNLCAVEKGIEGLQRIHQRKTAALIAAATVLGGICGGAADTIVESLRAYGQMLGLAFQVVDDILDVTGSAGELGKTPGKDSRQAKRTAVTELGMQGAAELADALAAKAVAALAPLGPRGADLADLADLLTRRTN